MRTMAAVKNNNIEAVEVSSDIALLPGPSDITIL
jgi:hypothetical protein